LDGDRFEGRFRDGVQLRISITGGARIHPELIYFFGSLGISLYQGYGMTETSPVTHVSTPEHNKIGFIGKPICHTETKIDSDGELLVRGPQVMQGYFRDPEGTRQAFTDDGFFRTGDIAEEDPEGFFRITDRKKELIITSGGKNIAPQVIQHAFDTDPYIEQVFITGENRQYIAALIVPNFEALEDWAHEQNIPFEDRLSLIEHEAVKAHLQQSVDRVNASLAQFETIKRFAILEREFSIEEGEMTPTLKLRREIIESNYREEIEGLYPRPVVGSLSL
jgi:long-chain acyl-CoA synthetase